MRKAKQGFGVIETLLVIAIVCLIGFVGWYVFTKRSTKPDSTAAVPATHAKEPAPAAPTGPAPLIIKEWGVKLVMPTAVADTTYTIIEKPQSNKDEKPVPVAYLSTKRLNADSQCKPLGNGETGLSFIRYTADTQIYTSDTLDSDMTAATAAKTFPEFYRQAGQYVYQFAAGNGWGITDCPSYQGKGSQPIFDGFKDSLATLVEL